ncbi:sensor histidine kinase [Xanthobacter autotrophicus]|uniref:sensor histidine kinase n=1 Tax=Xanthobacter autotrophicus TaxID=280 RepID=UPI0024A67D82|nr:HAMP domain-containing sensor histidine kinase [Xanthobacter autotrophicus]MDI4656388.1 HAMP domain-containing histidine kinase [Xanthobacter autotrophicus]
MGLGLTARVLSIAGTFLLVLWIGFIVVFYRFSGLSPTSSGPPPERLVAIADLLASMPSPARTAALPALRSPLLEVDLVSAAEVPAGSDEMSEREELEAYRTALGDRLIRMQIRPGAERRPLSQLLTDRAAPRAFYIALDGREVLVAEARTPFFVTFFGLPAGVGAGLFGAVLACVVLLLLHREIRPLARLAAVADHIDPTGEPVPLPHLRASTPEVRALVSAFERLQTRIHAMTRARLALIGGIQHDVRSFATRLRLRIDQLPDPVERERAEADIRDMIELLDNALLTARAGVGALDEEMLDLALLVRTEAADLRAAGRPVTLDTVAEGPVWVLADRLALRRVIGNIIDNAIKYGRRARVRLTVIGDQVRLVVRDDGPGFPPPMRDVLMEPFMRAEPSRARRTGGAGLGLAVARGLVEAHGGTIELGEGPGGQVLITLVLFRPG